MPDVDVDKANSLLGQKYNVPGSSSEAEFQHKLHQMKQALQTQSVPKNDASYWELIAAERLQVLMQSRDEANAWHEAFLTERARCAKLEELLFEGKLTQPVSPPEEETKHTVQPVEGMKRTRPNWPSLRRELEKRSRAGYVAGDYPEGANFQTDAGKTEEQVIKEL